MYTPLSSISSYSPFQQVEETGKSIVFADLAQVVLDQQRVTGETFKLGAIEGSQNEEVLKKTLKTYNETINKKETHSTSVTDTRTTQLAKKALKPSKASQRGIPKNTYFSSEGAQGNIFEQTAKTKSLFNGKRKDRDFDSDESEDFFSSSNSGHQEHSERQPSKSFIKEKGVDDFFIELEKEAESILPILDEHMATPKVFKTSTPSSDYSFASHQSPEEVMSPLISSTSSHTPSTPVFKSLASDIDKSAQEIVKVILGHQEKYDALSHLGMSPKSLSSLTPYTLIARKICFENRDPSEFKKEKKNSELLNKIREIYNKLDDKEKIPLPTKPITPFEPISNLADFSSENLVESYRKWKKSASSFVVPEIESRVSTSFPLLIIDLLVTSDNKARKWLLDKYGIPQKGYYYYAKNLNTSIDKVKGTKKIIIAATNFLLENGLDEPASLATQESQKDGALHSVPPLQDHLTNSSIQGVYSHSVHPIVAIPLVSVGEDYYTRYLNSLSQKTSSTPVQPKVKTLQVSGPLQTNSTIARAGEVYSAININSLSQATSSISNDIKHQKTLDNPFVPIRSISVFNSAGLVESYRKWKKNAASIPVVPANESRTPTNSPLLFIDVMLTKEITNKNYLMGQYGLNKGMCGIYSRALKYSNPKGVNPIIYEAIVYLKNNGTESQENSNPQTTSSIFDQPEVIHYETKVDRIIKELAADPFKSLPYVNGMKFLEGKDLTEAYLLWKQNGSITPPSSVISRKPLEFPLLVIDILIQSNLKEQKKLRKEYKFNSATVDTYKRNDFGANKEITKAVDLLKEKKYNPSINVLTSTPLDEADPLAPLPEIDFLKSDDEMNVTQLSPDLIDEAGDPKQTTQS